MVRMAAFHVSLFISIVNPFISIPKDNLDQLREYFAMKS